MATKCVYAKIWAATSQEIDNIAKHAVSVGGCVVSVAASGSGWVVCVRCPAGVVPGW